MSSDLRSTKDEGTVGLSQSAFFHKIFAGHDSDGVQVRRIPKTIVWAFN